MFMTFLFLAIWQGTNQPQYYEPTKKSSEAAYANSELKSNTDKTLEYVNNKVPAAKVVPILYVVASQHKLQYTTPKYTPLPGSTVTYKYEQKSVSINFIWRFE